MIPFIKFAEFKLYHDNIETTIKDPEAIFFKELAQSTSFPFDKIAYGKNGNEAEIMGTFYNSCF